MATFGKTTSGSTQSNSSTDKKTASKHTAPSSGTATTVHFRTSLDGAASTEVRGFIYADSSGAPGALLGVTNEVIVSGTSHSWWTGTLTSSVPIVSGTDYWIGYHFNDPGTNSIRMARDTTASGRVEGTESYDDGTSDPFGTPTTLTGVIDCYVTYTEAPSVLVPTVTTQAVSSITFSGATGNGNITDTGGENATRRGFAYMTGTSGDPTTANSVAYDDGSFGTGAFTKAITGLSAGTDYRVRAYAVNSAGTSYGTTVQLTTAIDSPATVLDIGTGAGQNHFKVQYSQEGAGSPAEVGLVGIEGGFSESPYFVTNATNDAVQFYAPVDGPTTGGSDYARSELREMNIDDTEIAFDATTGQHILHGRIKVTHFPPTKPDIILAQLHNGVTGDRISLRTQLVSGLVKLVWRINGTGTGIPRVSEDFQVNTEVEYKIHVSNNTIQLFIDDMVTPYYQSASGILASTGPTFYFKTGNYNQTNTTTDSATEYGSSELRDLYHWHTGWTVPTGRTIDAPIGTSTTGQAKVKSSGTFTAYPVKVKSGGVFVTATKKYKSGGTFTTTPY